MYMYDLIFTLNIQLFVHLYCENSEFKNKSLKLANELIFFLKKTFETLLIIFDFSLTGKFTLNTGVKTILSKLAQFKYMITCSEIRVKIPIAKFPFFSSFIFRYIKHKGLLALLLTVKILYLYYCSINLNRYEVQSIRVHLPSIRGSWDLHEMIVISIISKINHLILFAASGMVRPAMIELKSLLHKAKSCIK